jgi:hypothetical protein
MKKKSSRPILGRELGSRGSTQIKPGKPAHLGQLITGLTVSHTKVSFRPFPVHAHGWFSLPGSLRKLSVRDFLSLLEHVVDTRPGQCGLIIK